MHINALPHTHLLQFLKTVLHFWQCSHACMLVCTYTNICAYIHASTHVPASISRGRLAALPVLACMFVCMHTHILLCIYTRFNTRTCFNFARPSCSFASSCINSALSLALPDPAVDTCMYVCMYPDPGVDTCMYMISVRTNDPTCVHIRPYKYLIKGVFQHKCACSNL